MRSRGLHRVRQAARWFNRQFASGGLILLYHRVAEADSDPWSLCVTPQHFAEHLEILRKLGHPIQLQRLTQLLFDGSLPERPVTVTFDDGYADNLHNANPALERFDIPATTFLAAGYIGKREFWWDELERLLLYPGTLPEVLRLNINGSIYRWELGQASWYGEDAYQRHRQWSALRTEDPSLRHSLYRSLYSLLQPLTDDQRRKSLDELLTRIGTGPASRSARRPLSLAEALTLDQGGLIEIGAHTLTHPFLPALSTALQRNEIRQSKACLEEIIGRSVTSFAYPYGAYTAETADLVHEAGFARACSTVENTVYKRSDRFRLPRLEVQDWDGEEFGRRLSKWLRG